MKKGEERTDRTGKGSHSPQWVTSRGKTTPKEKRETKGRRKSSPGSGEKKEGAGGRGEEKTLFGQEGRREKESHTGEREGGDGDLEQAEVLKGAKSPQTNGAKRDIPENMNRNKEEPLRKFSTISNKLKRRNSRKKPR